MTIDNHPRTSLNLDVVGLFLAGLINTFLASFDAGIILIQGTAIGQTQLLLRASWIAENTVQWQAGWLFWFAVTLSFSWSYYALGRHLGGAKSWINLAIGLAVIAAAIDIVGVLINLVVLPQLAQSLVAVSSAETVALESVFASMESLSYALTNVSAFALYSVAGLLLLPALFATQDYPQWLRWLGVTEWGIAALASVLLILAPAVATVPLLISFLLFAPWVWGSGLWLLKRDNTVTQD